MQANPSRSEHGYAKQLRTRPASHTQRMQVRLNEIIEHLRQDIEKVDEPQLKAMFETSAEVLSGLVKAIHDYERRNEAAWQR